MTTTAFTFGYWGWGNHASDLDRLTSDIEKSRGFNPPTFVDIRISRNSRAVGFQHNAFADIVGNRYQWISGLGNAAIVRGGEPRLANPRHIRYLIDTIKRCQDANSRVVFFCACECPGTHAAIGCHRTMVAKLLLEESPIPLNICEWPGGEPIRYRVDVAPSSRLVTNEGHSTIPIPAGMSLIAAVSLPWYSIVEFNDKTGILACPAKPERNVWRIECVGMSSSLKEAQQLRRRDGYNVYRSASAGKRS